MFTKKGMTVLDPFVGSGTTLIAANNLGRRGIGIDLNSEYKELTDKRMKDRKLDDYEFIVGDANKKIDEIKEDSGLLEDAEFDCLKMAVESNKNNLPAVIRGAIYDLIENAKEPDVEKK